ncbi:MAG: class I SAM-dependent methyltransferase [Betaproteobacteria bacterium]|nr:class I SAM-dependent methyltransferase [Betaproteobacteria bacterium]
MDSDLVDYYRRRAAEYEAIYAKPERQADLARLRDLVAAQLAGRRVLEIACGTGYWTTLIGPGAASVVAVDMAEETLRIAAAKPLPEGKVRFEIADAYALPDSLGTFDAALAVFWWSHVPRSRIVEFLASLHARLSSGARVLLLDNRFVEGSSTPVSGFDAEGNTFQMRRLADGSAVRVLKNFPSAADLRDALAPHAATFEHLDLPYYWLASYTLK